METFFTTSSITKAFGISPQTVKNWCDEFAQYLSPSATPGDGKKRIFTYEDMQVFALVADYHKRGFRWDDAHAALKSGQRGELPQDNEIVNQPPPAILVALRDEIAKLKQQLVHAHTERDMERGKTELLEKLLVEKEAQIKRLYIDLARLEAEKGKSL